MQACLFFILIFLPAKMISSFEGEKQWEFTQIFTNITMEILKEN
jgi:hypothetical protein